MYTLVGNNVLAALQNQTKPVLKWLRETVGMQDNYAIGLGKDF